MASQPTVTAISLSSPTSGIITSGGRIDAVATFSLPVVVSVSSGVPFISLQIGGQAVNATYSSGSGTTAITFSYFINSGLVDFDGVSIDANSINLNGGKIYSVVTPGTSYIELGSLGKLIYPIQADGDHWYYHWDRNNDGTANGDFWKFYVSGSPLDKTIGTNQSGLASDYRWLSEALNIFTENASGQVGTLSFTGGQAGDSNRYAISDIYRYATINGVRLAIPTIGVTGAVNEVRQSGTTINNTSGINTTYDDLFAIWDVVNGPESGTYDRYWYTPAFSSSYSSFRVGPLTNPDSPYSITPWPTLNTVPWNNGGYISATRRGSNDLYTIRVYDGAVVGTEY